MFYDRNVLSCTLPQNLRYKVQSTVQVHVQVQGRTSLTYALNAVTHSVSAVATEQEIETAPPARIITCKLSSTVKFMLNVWKDALL